MEDNKLIAEFMGYHYVAETKITHDYFMVKGRYIRPNGIKFDTDWNWLMDVVDKIESIEDGEYDVNILKNGTQIINYRAGGIVICDNVGEISYSEKIEHVYQAVVNFIKWYEQNNN